MFRELFEKREAQFLAPYAMKSSETRGRRFPEAKHPYRTEFQRDRDRIVHSTAFRRLEYKTQVFVNHEGDHYRTRLTHTLEVAIIARSIARSMRLNEDLTETIALAHDLGHTPFGHSGEEALNELLKDKGGFEHNRQCIRVVDFLERRYPEFPGLNLTYEVREGILKHHSDYDNPQLDWELGLDGKPSLECQIVNLADEIAYNCHDVDDGLSSGVLTEDQLSGIEIWQELLEDVKKLHPKIGRASCRERV
jgi:dGTPase